MAVNATLKGCKMLLKLNDEEECCDPNEINPQKRIEVRTIVAAILKGHSKPGVPLRGGGGLG